MIPAATSAPVDRSAPRRGAQSRPAPATATWTTTSRSEDGAGAGGSGAPTMSLAPLLEAPGTIPLHAFAAMAAFALGIVQFAAPKGTLPHRTVGWIWVGLMVTVAASSFWIHQLRLFGPWSPIHLLSIYTMIVVPLAVWRARN